MWKSPTLFVLLILPTATESQELPLDTLNEEAIDDKDDPYEEHYERNLLVIANKFPEEFNFFCNPSNELMQDRICYGQLDAYALSCADDSPPLHLVPFCFAFKHQCSMVVFPSDDWCAREFDRYEGYCTKITKSQCKSCDHNSSCFCEPYECLWREFGYNTAAWCQRYELFCNANERRHKASKLINLMKDVPRIHYKCMHLFNLPKVICDPFRRQFDYNRCIKFLFDCELISVEDNKAEISEITNVGGSSKRILTPSSEDSKLAAKIAADEMALEKLLAEKENEDKKKVR